MERPGPCHRCGQPGHWADDPACPWHTPAATRAEHEQRIAHIVRRFHNGHITVHRKRELIEAENQTWHASRTVRSRK